MLSTVVDRTTIAFRIFQEVCELRQPEIRAAQLRRLFGAKNLGESCASLVAPLAERACDSELLSRCAETWARSLRDRSIPTVLEIGAGTSYPTRDTNQSIPLLARALGIASKRRWGIWVTDKSTEQRTFVLDGHGTLHYPDPSTIPHLSALLKMEVSSAHHPSKSGATFDRLKLTRLSEVAVYLGKRQRSEKILELKSWLHDSFGHGSNGEKPQIFLRPSLDPELEAEFGLHVKGNVDYSNLTGSFMRGTGTGVSFLFGRHLWCIPDGKRGDRLLNDTINGVRELLNPQSGDAYLWFDRQRLGARPIVVQGNIRTLYAAPD